MLHEEADKTLLSRGSESEDSHWARNESRWRCVTVGKAGNVRGAQVGGTRSTEGARGSPRGTGTD